MSETYNKVIVKLEYGTVCTNRLDLQTHQQLKERHNELLGWEVNLKKALELIDEERRVLIKARNIFNNNRKFNL